MSGQPNVLLIITDQWRGDCLSIAGHPVVHTPYLDTLAARGARFTRAYSACPTCIAARAALFTGMNQASHGRIGHLDGVPWNYPVTLAGEFTKNGYQTQAIGKMHVYPERSQVGFQNVILHDGFFNYPRFGHHNYDEMDDYIPWLRLRAGADADYFSHGVHCNSYVARPWDREENLHPTNWLTQQAVEFVHRRDPRKPFFLYLSYHRPHPPYDPPGWALEQYLQTDMPPVPVGNWEEMLQPFAAPFSHETPVGPIPPHLLKRARAGYYGHMTHIDYQLDRVFFTLKEYDQLDNTFICFVSDHGEMMGDHTMFRKAYPYDGSARVPLIFAGPRGSSILPNRSYDQVVELRDLMPTLLDCAGLPIPDTVQGKSFLSIMEGKPEAWREFLHGEHVVFGQSIQWLTNGKEKYIWWSANGREQFFDLAADPHEKNDMTLTGMAPERLTLWRQRLVEQLRGREEGFVNDGQLVTGRPVHPILAHLRAEAGMNETDRSNWHNRGAVL